MNLEAVLDIPALALSNALCSADPEAGSLIDLAEASQSWHQAVVLATPFWHPRTGKLHRSVDLVAGFSPLTAASIRFDPDREVRIAAEVPSDGVVSDATKAVLATARCLRVQSSVCVAAIPALLAMMPSLTAVHLANSAQLTASLAALKSLEKLHELSVTNMSDLVDLSLLTPLSSLLRLTLGGCFNLKDISSLKEMMSLQELHLNNCSKELAASHVESLPSQRIQVVAQDPWGFDEHTDPRDVPRELICDLVDFLESDDPDENMHATLLIRKMLNVKDMTTVGKILEEGYVTLLVGQLLRDEFPGLQFQSAWALSNIVGAGTLEVINRVANEPDAIRRLVRLLGSPSEDCREQAAWAIGNLSGERATFRDLCIDSGAVKPLVTVAMAPGEKESIVREAAWALSNLCRSNPMPDYTKVAPALPALLHLLNTDNLEFVSRAAWAFAYLSGYDRGVEGGWDRENEGGWDAFNTGCLPRMVELIDSRASSVATPALLTIQAIVKCGGANHAKAAIEAGVLEKLFVSLRSFHPQVYQAACMVLSQVTANGADLVQAVIDEVDLFPTFVKETAYKAYIEGGAAVVRNICLSSTAEQVDLLVQNGVLKCLCELMQHHHHAAAALEAIDAILKRGEQKRVESNDAKNTYVDLLVGGHEQLHVLANHNLEGIRQRAKAILGEYYLS